MFEIKNKLKRHLINIFGWQTNRKIVVFESDDWGSIRMASKEAYEQFMKKGYPVDYCAYSRNDALESNRDLEYLAEVLTEIKDYKDNPVIFTLNMISGNPDFERIEKEQYTSYYWEPFYKTLEKYPNHDNVLNIYKQGIAEHIFKPQFHGREHININRWMNALQSRETRIRDAVKLRTLTLPAKRNSSGRRDYLDSFGMTPHNEMESYTKIIKDGIRLFEEVWKFKPLTFMAPCYTWHATLENILNEHGIKGIQGTHVQRIPDEKKSTKVKRNYHYMGQNNNLGQYYLMRNAFFEPTEQNQKQVVEEALKDIKRAFLYKKPAIIQTHRLNYIGYIDEDNRDKNLKLLKELLRNIVKRFPDVEFMSSEELLKIVMNEG